MSNFSLTLIKLLYKQELFMNKVYDLTKKYPNDYDLGEQIRKLVQDEQNRRNSKNREEESIRLQEN